MAIILAIANFFSWFATTKVGQILGLVALVLGLLGTIWIKAKRAGRAEAEEKQRKETDDFISDKKKIDKDVAGASDSDLDDGMRPWIRN